MTVDGFHAEPDRIEVDAPTTPALTPAEALRLAAALTVAANTSLGHTSQNASYAPCAVSLDLV